MTRIIALEVIWYDLGLSLSFSPWLSLGYRQWENPGSLCSTTGQKRSRKYSHKAAEEWTRSRFERLRTKVCFPFTNVLNTASFWESTKRGEVRQQTTLGVGFSEVSVETEMTGLLGKNWGWSHLGPKKFMIGIFMWIATQMYITRPHLSCQKTSHFIVSHNNAWRIIDKP